MQSLGERVFLLSGRWSLCSGRGQGSAGSRCAEHGDLQVKCGGNVEVQYRCGLGLDGEGVRLTDLAGLAPPDGIASVVHTARTITEAAMHSPAPASDHQPT